MINITKHGTPEQDFIWEGTCYNCKTEFECNKSDIKLEDDHKGFFINYCPCPTQNCNSNVYMKQTKRTHFNIFTKTKDVHQYDRAYDQYDR